MRTYRGCAPERSGKTSASLEISLTQSGDSMGTPSYLSPEQVRREELDARTDLFSFGLVLYEMITGSPAFQGDTPVAVALKQIREYPKRPREIVPKLSHPVEAAILKCLQKDPAKRFQSVSELDAGLERAAKARAVPAWRVTFDRELCKADMIVRRGLRDGVEAVSAFTKRQDWRALTKFRTEPATALVVAVLLGGAISVALYARGKSTASGSQPAHVSEMSQRSSQSNEIAQSPVSEPGQSVAPFANRVITSHEVDLRRDSNIELVSIQSPATKSVNDVLVSEPTRRPVVPAQDSRAVKKKQTPARTVEAKTPSHAEVSAQLQAVTASAQAQTLLPAEASQPASPEAATKPPQPESAPPDPASEKAIPANVQKTADSAPKTSTVFIEVGSFKDETWAISAQEKLTQLGFHSVLIHKTLLWAQSFHVQVGPYTDPKDIEAARLSLSSHGFKSHLVN